MSILAKDVWIVVAAFNEAARIGKTVSSLSSNGWNIVVVDDGSRDKTKEIASNANAVVLTHLINRGQGAAIQTGMDFALKQNAKAIVTFDADGQHQSSDVVTILKCLSESGVDIVLGSRFLGSAIGIPFHRRWLLHLAVRFTRLTTGLRVTDTHNGLRAMTANAATKLALREDRMAHASEILHSVSSLKLSYMEHPVTIYYHRETLAKGQKTRDAWSVLTRLVISRLFA